jgi:hypothetical protein
LADRVLSSPHATSRLLRALVALAALSGLQACNPPVQPQSLQEPPGPPVYPVTIVEPAHLRSIETGMTSPIAQELRADCASCHSLRENAGLPKSTEELDEFHQGLTFDHGTLACASCHVEGRVDVLRLASGDLVPLPEVMTVCGQCHGSQKRDYDRGAHGGMQGYWDRSRGPQTRNSCVACHDPHAPAYVGGAPVLPPRDRFLDWKGPDHP